MSGGTCLLDDPDLGSNQQIERRWLSMRAGVTLYGLASAACGIMDLIWRDFDGAHQPIQAFGDHIPGREILACITGIVMIAGGVAVLWRRSGRAGAVALAVIYFIFTIFWLARLFTAPYFLGYRITVYVGVLAGVGMELIAVGGGALAYAALSTNGQWPRRERTIQIARWIFGLCSIDFGLNHLLNIQDNLIYAPRWMPFGPAFWVVLTGICFVLAGLAIFTGIQDVLATRLLALMFFAFNLFALPQFIFANPHEHAAWGGNAFNLALVAVNWILADVLATHRREVSSSQQTARSAMHSLA
jgi:uncharacterized membrane protein